jgi:hypothetical protein
MVIWVASCSEADAKGIRSKCPVDFSRLRSHCPSGRDSLGCQLFEERRKHRDGRSELSRHHVRIRGSMIISLGSAGGERQYGELLERCGLRTDARCGAQSPVRSLEPVRASWVLCEQACVEQLNRHCLTRRRGGPQPARMAEPDPGSRGRP